jgi:choloylglycine hydrolase
VQRKTQRTRGAVEQCTDRWLRKPGDERYELATVDSINEKGRVASVRYFAKSNYGSNEGRPTLSISTWGQYVLDNFARVPEPFKFLPAVPPKD